MDKAKNNILQFSSEIKKNLNCYPNSIATSKGGSRWLPYQRDDQNNACLDKNITSILLCRFALTNKDG